jgi:L-galactose dehydrogenase
MQRNQLGTTGMMVSSIGLGASSLGGGVFGPVDEKAAVAAVHAALDCGVSLIDVSPFYGATRAERVLGVALKGVPRDRFQLSTKVGRYGDGEFDFSAARVRKSVDESLERLGLEYVDFLHVHDVEYGDLKQIAEETLPALHSIVQAGKARFVGVTGYPLAALLQLVRSTRMDCVLTYNHCSLNDTTLLDVLPELENHGVGVISAGALSQGLLVEGDLPAWHPAPDVVRTTCALAVEYVRGKGVDPAALAIQFSSSQPGVACTLVGVRSAREIEDAVRAAASPLDVDLLQEILRILEPIHNRTWQTGRAENN